MPRFLLSQRLQLRDYKSLGTWDKTEALRVLMAKNEAEQQPTFNFKIARTYLAAGDPSLAKRTWKDVMDAFITARAES